MSNDQPPSTTTLKELLSAASVLLGQHSNGRSAKLGEAKPTLSKVLATRIDQLESTYPHLDLVSTFDSTRLEEQDQTTIEYETASTALNLLKLISSNLSTSSTTHPPTLPPSPSTSRSSSTTIPPKPPTFGTNDIKLLSQLGGIVARWGIGNLIKHVKVLPNQEGMRTKVGGGERFVEIDERRERENEEKLRLFSKELTAILKFREGGVTGKFEEEEGQKELRAILLPQVMLAYMGALAYLAALPGGKGDSGRTLEVLFSSVPLTTCIANLLTLLSASTPQSPHRPLLASLLTQLLLRPTGVRSLLIVVVGVGAMSGSAGAGDEVEGRKLEMVRRLVWNRGGTDEKVYFENVIMQLLTILKSATNSSLADFSPMNGKSPEHRLPPPPPASILQATSYLLSHFLVSPPTPSSHHFLLKHLHSPFLPLSYGTPPPPTTSSSRSIVSLSSIDLLKHLTTLSLLVHHAPPLPTLLSTLLNPLLANFFSLLESLSHHSQPTSSSSSASAFDRSQKNKAEPGLASETNERMEAELEAMLRIYGKGVRVDEGVIGLRKMVEEWENGREFGTREGTIHEDGGAGDWRVEWKSSRDRGIGLVWINDGIDVGDDEGDVKIRLPSFDETSPTSNEDTSNVLGLKVSSQRIVHWLKALDRKDLSAGLFLRWLDEVRVLRNEEGIDQARRTITRLQLVLKMVEELGSQILTEPTEIVAFVAHAFDVGSADAHASDASTTTTNGKGKAKERSGGFGLGSLRIVPDEEERESIVDEPDEEREFGIESGLGKDEIVMTALTLLLAVLEAKPDLSMSSTPLLRVIHSRLSSDSLASSTSQLVPPLAREAKMVLDLREASLAFTNSSSSQDKANDPLQASRDQYQEALKLLQDPLLPVRAQGLHLLRSLIKPATSASTSTPSISQKLLETDPALLPAILSIFLSALTEEDSFLYLNAVQGLSSLVDVFGRQVIGGLIDAYSGGVGRRGQVKDVGEGEVGAREIDKRLRVGEAMVQVIQRAGEALGTLLDVLLPPLLVTLRSSTLPVPLRASSITILATAVETAPIAMLPVLSELGEAMRQLLEIETVSFRQKDTAGTNVEEKIDTVKLDKGKGKKKDSTKGKAKGPVLIEEINSSDSDSDSDTASEFDEDLFPQPSTTANKPSSRPEELADPTSTHSRHPSLRRAALLFLGLLIRIVIKARYDAIEAAQDRAYKGLGETLEQGKLRMPGAREVRMKGTRQEENVGELGIGKRERERLRITLDYVRATDKDELVRFQAGEVLEEMDEAQL